MLVVAVSTSQGSRANQCYDLVSAGKDLQIIVLAAVRKQIIPETLPPDLNRAKAQGIPGTPTPFISVLKKGLCQKAGDKTSSGQAKQPRKNNCLMYAISHQERKKHETRRVNLRSPSKISEKRAQSLETKPELLASKGASNY